MNSVIFGGGGDTGGDNIIGLVLCKPNFYVVIFVFLTVSIIITIIRKAEIF